MVGIPARGAEPLHLPCDKHRLIGHDIGIIRIDHKGHQHPVRRRGAFRLGQRTADEIIGLFEADEAIHPCFGGGVIRRKLAPP